MLPDLTALDATPLFKLGNISLTLGGVITGAVMIGAAVVLAWAVTRGIRRLRVRAHRATGALYLLEKLAGYGIVVSGVLFGLSAAGLNLSSLAVFAGAIGIGIGLGLQGVVKEFVSGLFIIFDGMVSVGDYVELEGVRGIIAEIGPRATRIRNNDNIDVVVPNSKLIEGTVTNWTLKGDTRRIHIPFGVAYESDRAAVRDAVLAAARASPFTLPETDTRKSQVWLTGFGDSSLNFELLVWPTLDAVKRPAAMHAAYTWAIADALDGAGIEIPFPQTDLRVRSLFGQSGDDGLEAMGLKRPRAAPRPAAAADPSANDAAEELSHPSDLLPPESEDGDTPDAA
ncbi:mechanosensitive ion channel domain-containing protein [uncultured Brevundimonas sp.]|uniref:mechanosensitive ion channel family protein n=1 Tax=uncultured Brevundimonas sp. TaxID=213418 RepID=UPI0030EF31F7|tara:strand:+ start:58811 stop:59833 length:1023 start_codon:yes stop_codon:yes gene_type:complete